MQSRNFEQVLNMQQIRQELDDAWRATRNDYSTNIEDISISTPGGEGDIKPSRYVPYPSIYNVNLDILWPNSRIKKEREFLEAMLEAEISAKQETTKPKLSQSREIILFPSGKSKEIIPYVSSWEILKLRK